MSRLLPSFSFDSSDADAFRVMTFNLCRAKARHRVNRWERRMPAVVNVLDRYSPDIVGTQEGLPEQLADIRAHFPEYAFVGGGRLGGAEDEHNAILYRQTRFKLLDHGNFWLSDTPEIPGSRSWGNRNPRMATWARFRDKETGKDIHHTNTHFDHEIPGARRRAAELVTSRLPADGASRIVTGDLNSFSWMRPLKFLMCGARGANLQDSAAMARESAPRRFAPTFHKWTGLGLYRIDYVLLSGAFSAGAVHTVRDRVDKRYPSDHFPFYADVRVGEAPVMESSPAMPVPALLAPSVTSA